VFSRKIVGWEIHTGQTGEHASALFRKAHLREGVAGGELVLHSDNGSPMKGATLLVTLQWGWGSCRRPADPKVKRQPLLGGAVQNLQVPARLPRPSVRKPGACTNLGSRLRPLV